MLLKTIAKYFKVKAYNYKMNRLVNENITTILNTLDFTKVAQLLDGIYSSAQISATSRNDPLIDQLWIDGIIERPTSTRDADHKMIFLVKLTKPGRKICDLSNGCPELYKYNYGLFLRTLS